jgi:fumarate reductase subunit C
MNPFAVHPPYHPRWWRPRMSTYWWLGKRSYFTFILRELSSIFIAWFVVYVLVLVHAVSQGDVAYRRFLEWSRAPAVSSLNLITLFFAVFHSVTWFNLAPQAMAVRVRGQRIPGRWIAVANYATWALASAFVAWLFVSA